MLFKLFTYGQDNCCTFIKNILTEINTIEIWNEQCISNAQITEIKNKLHETFITKTLNDIFNSEKFPILRMYKRYTTDFRLENYLLSIENCGHQIALSKFRLSSHNLRIETGRYENPKLEPHNRICIFGDLQEVEDEKHFFT